MTSHQKLDYKYNNETVSIVCRNFQVDLASRNQMGKQTIEKLRYGILVSDPKFGLDLEVHICRWINS